MLVASGGLANISRQMAVISNNIANASTPDYARELGTQTAVTAAGQGMGVLSGNVVREIDLQLQAEVFHQNATVSALQNRQQALAPVDATQGTPGQGSDLGSVLGTLQNAFTSLQSDPSSSAAQSQAVSAANVLASKINTLSQAYTTARQNAQDGIGSGLTQLNSAVSTIANLTDKIVAARNEGVGTADLENQRDVAMHTMSGLVDVTFIAQSDGGMLASTSGGLAITLRNPAPQFSQASATLAQQSYYPGGGIPGIMLGGADVTRQLTGGQIGSNIVLRDTMMPLYQAELDEFANTIQSRLAGQGLNLFTSPTGIPTAIVPPPVQTGYVGYSASIAVNPAVLANPAQVRDGNVAIAGSATGSSAFTPNAAAGPASFSTLIERVLTYGFGTQAQSGVVQPASNVSGLGPLGTISAPYATPQDLAQFASALVSAQSADVGSTATALDTETSVQTSLKARVTSGSGVSTDSELSRMVGLQNAYGATARVIAASQAMWTQLLTAVV